MFLSTPPWSRAHRKTSAPRHRCTIEVGLLEGRLLMAGPGDVTAPVTVASLVGTLGQDGYYRGPVTANFSATDVDDPSNTLTTFSSVNGGTPAAGNSVTLTNDGIYTLAFFSKDPAGNVETAHTEVVRIDRTPPTITAVASPSTLFPPNHKLVSVTVTGHVADNLSGVAPTVTYHVVDEYGQVHTTDTISVDSNGNFRFVVQLPSSRRGQDKDGRQFVIDVTATDLAGNQATTAPTVTVLHDQGNHNGQGGTDPGGSGNSGNPTNVGSHGHGNQNHGHGNQNRGNAGKHGHATQTQGRVNPSPVIIDNGSHGSNGQGNGGDHGNGNHGNGNNGNHGNGNGNGHNK